MLHILWSIIVGFIIGAIAKFIFPSANQEHMGFIMTTAVGIGGSIVGGLIARLFSPPKPGQQVHPAGCIMSVVGALILLFVLSKLHL